MAHDHVVESTVEHVLVTYRHSYTYRYTTGTKSVQRATYKSTVVPTLGHAVTGLAAVRDDSKAVASSTVS